MRTLIIMVSGFALLAICLVIAKQFAGAGDKSMTMATIVFVALWFLAAAVNMWVGVYRAGYSFREELPIFLLIFLLPTAAAVIVRWRFL
jgi:hypothetical protein